MEPCFKPRALPPHRRGPDIGSISRLLDVRQRTRLCSDVSGGAGHEFCPQLADMPQAPRFGRRLGDEHIATTAATHRRTGVKKFGRAEAKFGAYL